VPGSARAVALKQRHDVQDTDHDFDCQYNQNELLFFSLTNVNTKNKIKIVGGE
jgi:hypothetical protein